MSILALLSKATVASVYGRRRINIKPDEATVNMGAASRLRDSLEKLQAQNQERKREGAELTTMYV